MKQLFLGVGAISSIFGVILDIFAAGETFGIYLVLALFIVFSIGVFIPHKSFIEKAPEWLHWKWGGLSSILAVAIILLFISQKSAETESGIIAELFPIIKQVQKDLKIIDEKLDNVSESVEKTNESIVLYTKDTLDTDKLVNNITIDYKKKNFEAALSNLEKLFEQTNRAGVDSALVYALVLEKLNRNSQQLLEGKYKQTNSTAYLIALSENVSDDYKKLQMLKSAYDSNKDSLILLYALTNHLSNLVHSGTHTTSYRDKKLLEQLVEDIKRTKPNDYYDYFDGFNPSDVRFSYMLSHETISIMIKNFSLIPARDISTYISKTQYIDIKDNLYNIFSPKKDSTTVDKNHEHSLSGIRLSNRIPERDPNKIRIYYSINGKNKGQLIFKENDIYFPIDSNLEDMNPEADSIEIYFEDIDKVTYGPWVSEWQPDERFDNKRFSLEMFYKGKK